MASITNESGGRRTIQFVGTDGKRRSIRLGQVSKRHAQAIKAKVEDLMACQRMGQPHEPELAQWIAGLDNQLRDRLVAVSLVERRAAARLGAFIDEYIAHRSDAKLSTKLVWGRTRNHLCRHFGEDHLVRSISAHDAERFQLSLTDAGLAQATARRTTGIAKQFFGAAVRSKLIEANPFDGLISAVPPNKARAFFVSRAVTQRLIDAFEDPEWKLLIALARYGGLRVPSEPLALRWLHIDRETRRIRVPSPKTEHHDGKSERCMPLFSELAPFLDAVGTPDGPSDGFVINLYRDTAVNLRTRLLKTMTRLGITPWPRLWQNMRASRETELVEQFPAHVVADWIGHSVSVAERNYLQVTDDHFAKAVQNPVQPVHAPTSTVSPEPRSRGKSGHQLSLSGTQMGGPGLEPGTPRM